MDPKKNIFENFNEINFERANFPKSSQKFNKKQLFLFQVPKNVSKFYV